MNRKTSPTPAAGSALTSRRGLFIAVGAALFIAAGVGGLMWAGGGPPAPRAELASENAPSIGEATAKVHIVEFLDPACETCAQFYPIVKQMLRDNPGKIRLSLRHIPLHQGSDVVVAMLEAARKQGKYFQTLERLLATQNEWVPRHVVLPDRVRAVVESVGLDMAQLQADMNTPEIAQRVARDRDDAAKLGVKQTPEYFVNGKQMTSFGREQLQRLVSDALAKAY